MVPTSNDWGHRWLQLVSTPQRARPLTRTERSWGGGRASAAARHTPPPPPDTDTLSALVSPVLAPGPLRLVGNRRAGTGEEWQPPNAGVGCGWTGVCWLGSEEDMKRMAVNGHKECSRSNNDRLVLQEASQISDSNTNHQPYLLSSDTGFLT